MRAAQRGAHKATSCFGKRADKHHLIDRHRLDLVPARVLGLRDGLRFARN